MTGRTELRARAGRLLNCPQSWIHAKSDRGYGGATVKQSLFDPRADGSTLNQIAKSNATSNWTS